MRIRMAKISMVPLILIMFASFLTVAPSFALTDRIQKKQFKTPSNFHQKKPGTLIKRIQPAGNPMLVSINPPIVNQGQTATLMISGRNLTAKMRLIFGDGVIANNFNLINDTGNVATIDISVSKTAEPGTRIVNVLNKEQITPSSVSFTVNETYKPPTIRAVIPNTFFPGKSYAVVLTGSDLGSLKQVDFGPGIKVKEKSLDARSQNSIRVDLNVFPSAEPGRRIVKAIDESGVHESSASVIVMASKSGTIKTEVPGTTPNINIKKPLSKTVPIIGPPMMLSGMVPNRWYTGKKYEVTVFGSQIKDNMQLNLGEGINIQSVNVKSPGIATLNIQVDKKAVSGPRMLKFRTNQFQTWTATNSQGFVLPVMKTSVKLPVAIKHTPLKDIEFIKGTIHLRTPEYGTVTTGHTEFIKTTNLGIPIVYDDIEFTWDEEQYGTSQWFELRILDRDNNILMKKKIDIGQPLDSFYIPDVAFLTELFSILRPDSSDTGSGQTQTSTSGKPSPQAKGSGLVSTTPSVKKVSPKTSTFYDKRIDCYWQVVGFKGFLSYKYSPQAGKNIMTTTAVEIASSERWPLQMPDYSPTGLICSAANTELTPDKVNENAGEAVDDNNFFVGDTLKLSGKFTLDGCPWSIKFDPDWHKPSYGPVADSVQLKNWLFFNVFIDWGDGSYDKVYATPTEEMRVLEGAGGGTGGVLTPGSSVWEPTDTAGKPTGKLDFLMTHTYRYPQKFPVRLFVLPEQDAGRIDAIVQANKSPKGGSVYQAAYQKEPGFFDDRVLLASSTVTASDAPMPVMSGGSKSGASSISNVSKSKPSIMSGFEKPGTSAFLIYCNPTVIDIRPDPFATGRLHLINIGIDHFSGQKAESDTPIDVSGAFDSKGKTTIPIPGKQNSLPSKNSNAEKFTLMQQTPNITQNNTSNPVQVFPASDAVASSCDEGLYATTRLEYYGVGRITLVWEADGEEIGRTDEDVGPSPIRTELDKDNNYTESIKHGFMTFVSPNLPLDVGGKSYKKYPLTVKAFLPGNEFAPQFPVGTTVTIPLPNGGKQTHTVEPDESKIEVIRKSEPKTYLVKAPVPGEPCAFKFPVADGQFFIISNIQNRVTKKNGLYSGEGTLYFELADSPGSLGTHFAEIHINDWAVDDDFMVTDGSIHEININMAMDDLPGVSGVLKTLKGKAGEALAAIMDVKIKDSGLHRVGAIEPPEWLDTEANLVPEDGWYAPDLAMPETEIYWSDFRISSNDIALDLSRLKGDKPESGASSRAQSGIRSGFTSSNTPKSSKRRTSTRKAQANSAHSVTQNNNNPGIMQSSPALSNLVLMWAGVDLGKTARLYPFLFNLEEIDVPAIGWNITDNGIQGNARFNKFEHVLGDGNISFDSIDITAENHGLDAVYEGVKINIPWPKVTLDCGRATVHYVQGPGAAKVAFDFNLNDSSVTEKYQNVTMTSDIKLFEKRGSGWGILTDTTFDFTDGRNDFATAVLTDLFFNVYGEAHFTGSGDQVYNRTIPFNESTTFGATQYTLAGLNVFAAADHQKEERLSFTFNGQIGFHEAFNAPDVKVFYKIDKPLGKSFQAMGPGHSDIKICSDFSPAGETLSRIEVHPEINLQSSPGMSDNSGDDNSLISTLMSGLVPSAHASSGVQDTFSGQVNAQMFGVDLPGVTAKFRYGTHNNQTYWLTHLLGYTDITIWSGVNLKAVNGGISHGFAGNVFTSSNIMNAIPSGSATLYSAGITIGSPGTNVYSMTGQLTVDLNDPLIRMDCDPVSLFSVPLGGGYFKYANSVFDGGVFGGYDLYGGALSCKIPHDETDPRVGLHFGGDYWEIWAGRQNNPLTIKLLNVVGADGYFQFGSPPVGFRVGGGMSFTTPELCAVAFSASVSADSGMSMAITPVKIAGSFWIGVDLNVWFPCYVGKHFSFGPDIAVDVSAPPLEMNARARFKLPKLFGGKTYSYPFDI